MHTFIYKSAYGTYKNCYFNVGHYSNDNIAIEILSAEEGPICKVTVNPDIKLPDSMIAVKDYSENEGMVDWLVSEGYITSEAVSYIPSGWVTIPVHKLTSKGLEVFKS